MGDVAASVLGREEATLLDRDKMVPWFQRVCGGRDVCRDLLRSRWESLGLVCRGGEGGNGLLLILLLLLRTRRKKGWSSGSGTAGGDLEKENARPWREDAKSGRVGLAEAGGVGGSALTRAARVAKTWLGSGS